MMKYYRVLICILYTNVKFALMKLVYFKEFKFNLLSLISPFTSVEIERNAKLVLGKMIKARSRTIIKVRKNSLLSIGNYTSFNYGCIVVARENISIGKNVQFGPNVLIFDHDHDFRGKGGIKSRNYKTSPIVIGDNVWIGANTVILRGTTIANNCVIGAGSVIKGNFEEGSVIIQKRSQTR